MSDTEVTRSAAGTPVERCPVDHKALAAAEAAGCPVDHAALAASRPSSTCAYAPGNAKRGYLIPGLIAFVVLLAIGAILDITDFSSSSGSTLHGPLVANQIATAYQTGHGGGVPSVTCPASEPVAAGRTFTCQMSIGGRAPAPITVTETGGGRFGFQEGSQGGGAGGA